MAYTDNFQTDYNQLTKDLNTFQQEMQQYEASIKAYAEKMKELAHTKDPMLAFLLLSWIMGNQGLQELNLHSAVDGGALQLQGDLTKLGNDIENTTNQDSTDSKLVEDVASHADQMIDLLKNNQELRGAIGSEAADSLESQYVIIRHQIYWKKDPNQGFNPTGSNYYFDPTGANGKISSYGQLQKDLQERGDPQQANEAEKQKTDAFNEMTSTTQSTNAASQEQISNDSNTTKSVQAFVVDMFHSILDVISASVKASARGS